MYIRYELATPGSSNSANQLLSDIYKIFDGTVTSVSGFSAACNQGLSTWTGSLNTSLYATYTQYIQSSATYQSNIGIRKYHSAKTTGYTPSTIIGMSLSNRFASGPSFGFRFLNSSAANIFPGGSTAFPNTTSYYSGFFDDTATGYTTPYPSAAGNISTVLARVLIWANDNSLVFHFIYTNGTMATGGIFDYESSASDVYAYGLNATTSPQVYMSSLWTNMTGNSPPANGTSCGLVFGRGAYLQGNNSIYTTTTPWNTSNFDLHYGNQGNTASSLAPTIYPLPRFSQPSSGLSAGSSHYITPVYYMPGFNNGATNSVSFGKLTGFYRTTDDIADSGELITDANSTTYAVLRLHKTKGYGAADYANQTPNACYLIPV